MNTPINTQIPVLSGSIAKELDTPNSLPATPAVDRPLGMGRIIAAPNYHPEKKPLSRRDRIRLYGRAEGRAGSKHKTVGDTTVKQLPDGTWKATAPIGTIFGLEVEGECSGIGPTKEAAIEALAKDRRNLNDSL